MITFQRWSVVILFIIFILVLILGNQHWEKSIRQQGTFTKVNPISTANPSTEPTSPASSQPEPSVIPTTPAAGSTTVTVPTIKPSPITAPTDNKMKTPTSKKPNATIKPNMTNSSTNVTGSVYRN